MSAAVALDELASEVAEIMLSLPDFGGLVEVKTKSKGKIPFGWSQWFPEQRRFERERTGRDIVLKPRQIGFTTLELLRDFQYARTHEGAQVVVVVHDGAAKNDLFSAIHLMERCLRKYGLLPAAKENTKTGIRWDDLDSSIKVIEAGKDETTAASRGRSGTIHRLHVTEAAFYKSPEETLTALFAAVADAGEIVIESTANGVGNWFHEHVQLAREGRFEDFKFHFFPWYEHPEYRAEPGAYPEPVTKREQFWENELRKLGCDEGQISWWRRQVVRHKIDKALREYPPTPDAAFTESGESWIAPEYLDRMRAQVREPLEQRTLTRGDADYGPLRIYKHPEPETAYIVIADPAEGVGLNEAAITVMEHRSAEIVACWDNRRVKPGALAHVVAMVGRMYNNALVAVERNAWAKDDGDREGGHETLQVLERDERYPRLYRDKRSKKLGWATSKESRALIFGDLANGIESPDGPTIWHPDAKAIAELASVVLTDKGPRVPAKNKGRGDDGLIVTWGIGLQVRHLVSMPGKVVAKAVGPTTVASRFRT